MNAEIELQAIEILENLPTEQRNIIIEYINKYINSANEAIDCYKKQYLKCCEQFDDMSELCVKAQKRYDKAEPYYLGSFGSIKLPFGFVLMKPVYKYVKENEEEYEKEE